MWALITILISDELSYAEYLEFSYTWTQGVWTFNGESKKRIGHPAPFPKELPYRCIKLFSFVGDCVFDSFFWKWNYADSCRTS